MSSFDLDAYLGRIRLDRVPLTAEGLRALQSAQLRHVPFENIDPFLGRVPDLSIGAIANKILHDGRGGYCFELNTLLGSALAGIGFPARRVLARVRHGRPEAGPRTHLAWIAVAEGRRFLVDAGFGGPGALEPLELVDGVEQPKPNGVYRLRRDEVTGETVVERRGPEGWFATFGFDEAWVGDADVAAANHVCATWSEAPFPNHLMVNVYRGDTRWAIFDLTVKEEGSGQTIRRDIRARNDFEATLVDRLDLRLDGETLDALWRRIEGRRVGATA